jgi:hypothetical protein
MARGSVLKASSLLGILKVVSEVSWAARTEEKNKKTRTRERTGFVADTVFIFFVLFSLTEKLLTYFTVRKPTILSSLEHESTV